jgi:aquaporin Z
MPESSAVEASGRHDEGRGDEHPLSRRLVAEALGTFALVFVAVGGDAMAALAGGQIGSAARAVAPGLIVGALIYSIGDVSGAHFNPVVTVAFALKRVFPVKLVPGYWAAQLVGAVGAAVLVSMLFGADAANGVTSPHLVDDATALVIEVILTSLLLTVILGTADRARIVGPDAALAVAATISLAGLIALPIEGASMNPIRSLAPALVTGHLGSIWVYVIGPTLGALVAVAINIFLHGHHAADPKTRGAAQGES